MDFEIWGEKCINLQKKKEDKRQVFWTFFLNFLVIKNNLVLISHTLYLIKLLNVEELHEKLIRLGDFWLILWFIFSCYFLFLDVYWRQKWINFYFEPGEGRGKKTIVLYWEIVNFFSTKITIYHLPFIIFIIINNLLSTIIL